MSDESQDHEAEVLKGLPEMKKPWGVLVYATPSPHITITRFCGEAWKRTYRRVYIDNLYLADIYGGLGTSWSEIPVLLYEIGRISVTFRGWMARRIF